MDESKNAYDLLEKRYDQINNLNNILGIIGWDYSTSMPPLSAATRQDEIATLSGLVHNMTISQEIKDLISSAEVDESELTQWQKSNLREIKRSFAHASSISCDLQQRYSKASNESEFIWREAKQKNDYDSLKPYLRKVLALTNEVAEAKSQYFKISKYDALIDLYEPESNSQEIRNRYLILKKQLPDLIQTIMEKQASYRPIALTEKIGKKIQKAIGEKIMEKMGFNFQSGRLDESAHPFCGGTSNDVRITTNYREENFIPALMGVIHETGHALYEMNLPKEYSSKNAGKALGMAFHESQSLIMEMQACRSLEFTEFLAKLLKDEFGFKGEEYSHINLFRLLTEVRPGFIRVDADEVTYPLHVILRFEIEEEFLNGSLNVEGLPEYWNSKMKEYLGIVPTSYKNGCLQDIHWPSGSFGYFPSYTNGAMIASMVMASVKAQNRDIMNDLRRGDFNNLNLYLNENLRNAGSSLKPADLLEKATGYREIQPEIFLNYLRQKYL
ncbi:MAG: carboxypeptidase M32 [Janthinobacterium lividum]